MVTIVEVGVEAEAIEARSKAIFVSILKMKNNTVKVRIEVNNASIRVIMIALTPFFFHTLSLKYLPAPKAINAVAISVMNSMPFITLSVTSPKQNGPIKMPTAI